MKFLILILAVFGLAAASFHDAILDDTTHEVVAEFKRGMDEIPSLKEILGLKNSEEVDELEEDVKSALIDNLQKVLNNLVEKIKDGLEHKHKIAIAVLDKTAETIKKLKELGQDGSLKVKNLLQDLKNRVKDKLQQFLEKLGLAKRSLKDFALEMLLKFELDDIVDHVKKMIEEKLSIDVVKEYVTKTLGDNKLVKDLLKLFDLKTHEELKAVIGYILELALKETKHSRSVLDFWTKVQQFLKDLKVETREKFVKFAGWLKTVWTVGIEKATTKIDKLRLVAKEFVKDAKNLTDEVLQEGLQVLSLYKEELGDLWFEVVETVKKLRRDL